jgi:hypothetical protein
MRPRAGLEESYQLWPGLELISPRGQAQNIFGDGRWPQDKP